MAIALGDAGMPIERPCQKSMAENSCHFADVFPFFKNHADLTSLKTIDKEEREKLKNEIIFLTELSRFMNQKAPLLLKVSTAMLPQSCTSQETEVYKCSNGMKKFYTLHIQYR